MKSPALMGRVMLAQLAVWADGPYPLPPFPILQQEGGSRWMAGKVVPERNTAKPLSRASGRGAGGEDHPSPAGVYERTEHLSGTRPFRAGLGLQSPLRGLMAHPPAPIPSPT
ncbi:hypothetical protein A6A03_05995 [Chloroflexus islandicus]|uniref:Uncharacterized protein n=1 Tax=Chloroflexus islandicus TaxID=1707952 RepID=A0A178LTC9_9CHLR|nr:hypothetical protein A6A03_05995 [Chloroflexus islandicus]